MQKVSTTASSILSGYFTLAFEDQKSNPIPYDASADQMQFFLEQLSNVGKVSVPRIATVITDTTSWATNPEQGQKSTLNLEVVEPLLQYDLNVRMADHIYLKSRKSSSVVRLLRRMDYLLVTKCQSSLRIF